eukprot:gnl/MRDRNA2_/MRDRNA2_188307_c0_seq1.p2 gnl/MRDRNA2_/MRDRNA2_188307_c0~~gnl/MRDRNA2_/MRDRNA2_188307_c0_seq1.p2  ORF type:complete len:113 (+),score=14.09 gnl/MRDRNA2_/MRDRNA2_188307_c0_seq1:71-409(+)
MSSCKSARDHMPEAVVPMLSPEQQSVYKECRAGKDGELREAFYFGKHFMILPNAAPKDVKPEDFLGFRGNRDGGEPALCHRPFKTKPNKSNIKNCAREETMCRGGGSCKCDA